MSNIQIPQDDTSLSFTLQELPNLEELDKLEPTLNPEPNHIIICCRCNQDTELFFENDQCDHQVCINCRFTDSVQCTFCLNVQTNISESEDKHDSLPASSSCLSKKTFNKDHIVDAPQLDTDRGPPRQMCTICQRQFLKSNARYHYACASGIKPFTCSECDQRFVKKSHLESHINSHFGIKPFKCSVASCNASFTQKDKLVRHLKIHSSEKYMCEVCDKTFSSLPNLQFHMQRVHITTKLFKCDKCPRKYKYKKSLKVHLLKHENLKEHLCETCGKKYITVAQLKQHMQTHVPLAHRPYRCKQNCKQRFITQHDKNRHELIHATSSPDYECSLCNITFGRKDNLERHMKNFHQQPWTGKAVQQMKIAAPGLVAETALKSKRNNKSAYKSTNPMVNHNKFPKLGTKQKINQETVLKVECLDSNPDQQINVKEVVIPVVANEHLPKPEANQSHSVIVRPSVIKNYVKKTND